MSFVYNSLDGRDASKIRQVKLEIEGSGYAVCDEDAFAESSEL
jgi:hypothetical protein